MSQFAFSKDFFQPVTLDAARAAGQQASDACTARAERVAKFDTEGARKFVHGWLERHGPTSGEDLVDALKAHGYRPEEDRAFGAVFGTLSRQGLIRCVGYCMRAKGHACAGGRVWEAA